MRKNFTYFFICLFISFLAFMGFRLHGFCAVALSPESITQFQSFSSAMAQSGMGFYVAPPEIAITELLNNINYNLYEVYGYDLMDLSDDVWNSISDPTEWYNNLTKYASGEYTVDGSRVDVSVANRIAQRISQGVLTGAVTAKNLLDAGYRYFSTSVPQWGENAKQFIIGKIDSATNQIVDVAPTMVTKITAEGLAAYNQVYNNLVNSGDIVNISNNTSSSILTDSVSFSYSDGTNFTSYTLFFDNSFWFYSYSNSLCLFGSKTGSLRIPCSGSVVYNGTLYNVDAIFLNNYNESNVPSGYFVSTNFDVISGSQRFGALTNIDFGSLQDVLSHYENPYSSSFDYSSSSALSIALKEQLDRLIGKYVDSITLGRINDIVSSIPIGKELVGENDVPVAIPTQEVVDELTDIIDDALALDEDYAIAFDDAYSAEIESTPDPEPSPYPDSTGTAVPDDFPEAPIFDPLVDIVKTPFSFFSIFEPIFLVFGASFNFFTVWLCFPVILVILLFIWALK